MSGTKKEFDKILEYARALRERKNSDYGDGFLKEYNNLQTVSTLLGNTAIYYDLKRKFGRIENILLTGNKNKVSDETIEDTLIDLAIISLNAVVAIKKRTNKK